MPHKLAHALQPLSNILTAFGFGTALNLQVTGMIDLYFKFDGQPPEVLPDTKPETVRAAHLAFVKKFVRYYGKEYVFFPLLAGPFVAKVFARQPDRRGGARRLRRRHHLLRTRRRHRVPGGTEAKGRGQWYAMQVEGSLDVDVSPLVSILTGGLDHQIEHHLFPRCRPTVCARSALRCSAICAAHGDQPPDRELAQDAALGAQRAAPLGQADAVAQQPEPLCPDTRRRPSRHHATSGARAGRVAAFFDLDRTLIRENSGQLYALNEYKHGRLSGSSWCRAPSGCCFITSSCSTWRPPTPRPRATGRACPAVRCATWPRSGFSAMSRLA